MPKWGLREQKEIFLRFFYSAVLLLLDYMNVTITTSDSDNNYMNVATITSESDNGWR